MPPAPWASLSLAQSSIPVVGVGLDTGKDTRYRQKDCVVGNERMMTILILERITEGKEIRVSMQNPQKVKQNASVFTLIVSIEPLFPSGSNSGNLPLKDCLWVTASEYIRDLRE
jgi:hypothetical protein